MAKKWCKHIDFLVGEWEFNWDGLFVEEAYMRKWNLCPICGKKKPKARKTIVRR